MPPTVTPLHMTTANAYLVRDHKTILVDSGVAHESTQLYRAFKKADIDPNTIALIVQTHGHNDHAGNSAMLQREHGIPVAVHHADATMLTTGKNRTLHPTDWEARLIRPFVDRVFPSVDPDIFLDDGFDLRPYGIEGHILTTPGHTSGSISLQLSNGEAIVGDLLMGGRLGGQIWPSRPREHYFVEDTRRNAASVQRILASSPTRLYVGHGGPLDLSAVERWFANQIASQVEPQPAAN